MPNFIHVSDLHLGYMQYGLEERFKDYAVTFMKVADYAIEHQVDFMLISGDLFDKRNINAPTYLQAYEILEKLRQNNIPVIAIEGNHDIAYARNKHGWLQILEAQELLKLIKIKRQDKDIKIMGDYKELNNVRIFGMRFIGSSTRPELDRISKEITIVNNRKGRARYTILMMHFGMEGQLKREIAGEIPYQALLPLKDSIDYLALGHYHMQYEYGNWVFNPGSPDMISMEEYGCQKGFYHVHDGRAELVTIDTRPVFKFDLDVSTIQTVPELYDEIKDTLSKKPQNRSQIGALIEFNIWGKLNFPKTEINTGDIQELIRDAFEPMPLNVNLKIRASKGPYAITERDVKGRSRDEIETKVLTEQVAKAGYNDVKMVTETMIDVKNLAVDKATPEIILDKIRRSLEQWRF